MKNLFVAAFVVSSLMLTTAIAENGSENPGGTVNKGTVNKGSGAGNSMGSPGSTASGSGSSSGAMGDTKPATFGTEVAPSSTDDMKAAPPAPKGKRGKIGKKTKAAPTTE